MYFNGASWSLFFDGGDVGLKTTGERINGLEVLPGSVSPIGSGCQYCLLISTVAGGGVPVGPTNVNFTGDGGLVKPSELFSFSGGVFSGPLWKAADHGLTQLVDGIDVVGAIP